MLKSSKTQIRNPFHLPFSNKGGHLLKLLALEIQGFKSFAEKVKLTFDTGITAVVGPNGSGKSNIADAVKWVLGEQSVKSLRGGKMEDVIFNGTEERKALGVASVTLIIDNSSHELPYDEDEVAVKRKLYRSGESEYRINEKSVRLKDVYELFMDTGIGRDGYAIIGQGKVAEIVSAKNKERREIFEEAAGISKFRYRKQEAEKQLSLSEENLSRLLDIEGEIEARLDPLKKQSEKAQRYLELYEKKKELEVSLTVGNLSSLKREEAENEDRLILASNQHREAEENFEKNGEEYNLKSQSSKLLNAEIDDLRASLDSVNDEISSLGSKTAVIKNDISHFEEAIKEIGEEMEKSALSKEEVSTELKRLENEKNDSLKLLDSLTKSLEDIKKDRIALDIERDTVFKDVDSTKLKRAGLYEAIEKAKLTLASSRSIIIESSQRLDQLDFSRKEFSEDVKRLKEEIESCQELFEGTKEKLLSIDNSISGYTLKRASRENKLAQREARINEVKEEAGHKEQKIKVLTDMENSMEGFFGSVKTVMKASNTGRLQGILGPVSSLITTEDRYRTAIETALGASLQNIVTEKAENAKSAIYLLKNQKAGRATFLPLDTVKANETDMGNLELLDGFLGKASELIKFDKRFCGIFTWLLGRTIIAETLDHAMEIAKRSSHRYKVVTLDGQVINAGGSMTGGFTAKSSGLLSRKSEIEKLTKECSYLLSSIKEDREESELLKSELRGINAEISALENSKKALREDNLRAEMQKKSLLMSLSEKEKSLSAMDREQEAVTNRIKEIKGQGDKSDKLFEELNGELASLQDSLNRMNEKTQNLRGRKDDLLEKESRKNADILVLEERIESLSKDIENQKLIIASNENTKKENLLKTEALKEKISASLKENELLRIKDEKNRSLVVSLEKQIEEKINTRNENDRSLSLLREREKEISQVRDELYKEVMRLTQKKEKLEGSISSLVTYLYDTYELTLSEAEKKAVKLKDIHASQRELAEIKSRIKSLGNVNLEAIEEYKEVKNRFEEMKKQIDDIEKAKRELTKLIGELTDEMCSIFKDKFREISRNFSSIFRELFGGGQAHLTLTEPDNILESGIDITAAPPGKVIKNLSSLSGGEQSFVAIAIFFAILKVNPSPFCLMDEIEAALDDVNVDKFASYLHTLTEKTQFIAITHRRGTMEEADVLYGVTMQEEGVSKLLKLDINSVQKDFYK